ALESDAQDVEEAFQGHGVDSWSSGWRATGLGPVVGAPRPGPARALAPARAPLGRGALLSFPGPDLGCAGAPPSALLSASRTGLRRQTGSRIERDLLRRVEPVLHLHVLLVVLTHPDRPALEAGAVLHPDTMLAFLLGHCLHRHEQHAA